jgi:hypothetical protein
MLREGVIGGRKGDGMAMAHWPAFAGFSKVEEEGGEDDEERRGVHVDGVVVDLRG